jgi:hypothetical protein
MQQKVRGSLMQFQSADPADPTLSTKTCPEDVPNAIRVKPFLQRELDAADHLVGVGVGVGVGGRGEAAAAVASEGNWDKTCRWMVPKSIRLVIFPVLKFHSKTLPSILLEMSSLGMFAVQEEQGMDSEMICWEWPSRW